MNLGDANFLYYTALGGTNYNEMYRIAQELSDNNYNEMANAVYAKAARLEKAKGGKVDFISMRGLPRFRGPYNPPPPPPRGVYEDPSGGKMRGPESRGVRNGRNRTNVGARTKQTAMRGFSRTSMRGGVTDSEKDWLLTLRERAERTKKKEDIQNWLIERDRIQRKIDESAARFPGAGGGVGFLPILAMMPGLFGGGNKPAAVVPTSALADLDDDDDDTDDSKLTPDQKKLKKAKKKLAKAKLMIAQQQAASVAAAQNSGGGGIGNIIGKLFGGMSGGMGASGEFDVSSYAAALALVKRASAGDEEARDAIGAIHEAAKSKLVTYSSSTGESMQRVEKGDDRAILAEQLLSKADDALNKGINPEVKPMRQTAGVLDKAINLKTGNSDDKQAIPALASRSCRKRGWLCTGTGTERTERAMHAAKASYRDGLK